MPKGEKEEGFTDKLHKQVKTYTDSIDTDKIKHHSKKLGEGIVKHSTVIGKGVAQGSAVVGKSVVEGSKALGHGVVEGTKVVGHGVKEGTILLGKGTVAAAKGIKHGLEVSVDGVKHFLGFTAEKLHLKKPDMHALDDFEEEISPYLPTEIAKRWYMKNVKLKPKQGKGKLVLKWNRVFCWHDNPFTMGIIQPIDDFFVCDKKMKTTLNLFLVKGHPFGRITGDEGAGKSTFLHWIYWELQAHHPEVVACFIDASGKKVSEKGIIKQFMSPFLNVYQKTVSRPFEEVDAQGLAAYIARKVSGKPFLILVDEPHNLNPKVLSVFDAIVKTGIKVQLIIAGRKEDLRKTTLGKNQKDMLKFDLTGLNTALAVQMLKQRIEAVGGEGIYPFDEQKVRVLVQHTKGNPAKILQKAKEKVIQISVDRREEIIAEQKEIIRQKQREIEQKIREEKERRKQEREKRKQDMEEERRRHMEEEEKRRLEELEKQREILAQEDSQLDKIDDMIGDILGSKKKKEAQEEKVKEEKKHKEKDTSAHEMKKHDELVHEAIGRIPEEKDAEQILAEDPDLAADLQAVLEETAAASKKHKTTKKKPAKKKKK